MKQKLQKCKGINKARNYKGCAQETLFRKAGLCVPCYSDWLLNTEEGQAELQKQSIKAKKGIEHKNKKETVKKKRALLSVDAYRAKHLQPVINEIVRLIDFEQPCIATGNFGKMNGGHFTSVGANRLIALNLHNIHIQSYASNSEKGGQPIEYMEGLIKIYGKEYFDFVLGLRGYKRTIKFSKSDFEAAYTKATKIRNELKRNNFKRDEQQRIELRNKLNQEIGLYTDSIFELVGGISVNAR